MKLLIASVASFLLFATAQAKCRCYNDQLILQSKAGKAFCKPNVANLTQLHKFGPKKREVKYEITVLVDDELTLYADGKKIMVENSVPKRRHRMMYEGPCVPLIANVTNINNNEPRLKSSAGLSVMIKYKGVTYGSAQQHAYSYCASPVCAYESARRVKPIFLHGAVEPPNKCFRNPHKCPFETWNKTVVNDRLTHRPLCEFVDFARQGAMPVNPSDTEYEQHARFGFKIDLPFCV